MPISRLRSRLTSRCSIQRDPSAYLNDIIEAAAAIEEATVGLNSETYGQSRLIRSAVEREFIIIGEALKVISRRSPALFASIPEGRQIIDFRNLLTHEYLNVSDRLVWGAIQVDLPSLKDHCRALLQELNPS
ncbi:DUF86 domain-containing protein [Synechococcus sp. EJ6-Ellesmere]|uniref:DUF86 domain-containing protein n=1 Tax=Synechococcus sp. EJ6-Ellesmere TaxID=2823734 RepID=UPI0037D9C7E2|nr:DUF86 domain-containing protein [Synechococcus sp. EJ6-Ellesmere]